MIDPEVWHNPNRGVSETAVCPPPQAVKRKLSTRSYSQNSTYHRRIKNPSRLGGRVAGVIKYRREGIQYS